MAEFGLMKIARLLGREDAVVKLLEAAALEEAGDCSHAIKSYKQAYKMWDALDSVLDESGLPTAVRREAEAAGLDPAVFPAEVVLDTQESPRFDPDAPTEWLAYLDKHGYVVLAGIADADAVNQAKSLLWDFLESVPGTKVKREDSCTWEEGWLPDARNGILGSHGFGQSDFCWHARTLPKLQEAFEAVWNCKDMLVSFDGGNVFRPWERKPEWKTSGGWWHMDQNAFLEHQDCFKCVQGLVTFTDATLATGGLCVIPGSHKHHKAVCQRACAHILSGHYVQVQLGDPVLTGARLVCAKSGDLVLWDSRCVHCNTPGLEKSGQMDELLRVVAYVCMTPASWASSAVLAHRREGFLNNATIDHVPHEWHGGQDDLSWPPRKSWSDASPLQKRLISGKSAPDADLS